MQAPNIITHFFVGSREITWIEGDHDLKLGQHVDFHDEDGNIIEEGEVEAIHYDRKTPDTVRAIVTIN